MNPIKRFFDTAIVVVTFVVFGLGGHSLLAQATNATWNARAGNWTVSADWNCPVAGAHCVPNTVPNAAYYATINSAGAKVTLDGASTPAYIFVSALSVADGKLTVSKGGSLGANSMEVTGGTFSVDSGSTAYTRISSTEVQIGAGQPVLVANPSGSGFSPLVLSGLPTSQELFGDFSSLEPEQLYSSSTNPPSPILNNMIPASELNPNGMFVPLDGNATIGNTSGNTDALVSVKGIESAWNIASTLTINSTGTLSVTNKGSVKIGHPAGSVLNSGIVVIGKGSSLSISGSTPLWAGGDAYIQAAGQTDVNGTLIAPGGMNINGGVLSGSGMIEANVVSSGVVSPGDPTKLMIIGNYTQNSNGALTIDISSLTNFTMLDVTGTAALNGTVNFNFLDGYVPPANVAFPFLEAGYTVGAFTKLNFVGINCKSCFFDPYTVTLDTGDDPPTSAILIDPTPESSSFWLFTLALLGLIYAFRRKVLYERKRD